MYYSRKYNYVNLCIIKYYNYFIVFYFFLLHLFINNNFIQIKTTESKMNKIQKDDKCFPFESATDTSSILNKESNEEDEEKISTNDIFNIKFKTKKYYVDNKGKKRKERKKRKYKTDNIRKKIKVKFHKTLKNIINNNLKRAGSKKFFKFLPNIFMGNISQKFNFKYLNYTYEELLTTDFTLNYKSYRNKTIDYKIYLNNKKTVEYLKQNETISINSGFSFIKSMKYKDLINAYFSSKQYEYSILELKTKKENLNYIQNYIKQSKEYLNYFGNIKKAEEINKEIDNYFSIDSSDIFSKLSNDYDIFMNNDNF